MISVPLYVRSDCSPAIFRAVIKVKLNCVQQMAPKAPEDLQRCYFVIGHFFT